MDLPVLQPSTHCLPSDQPPGRKHRAPGRRYDVYTTGQVAAICRTCPRTVSRWCDLELLKSYRIPGSRDRRVLRQDLIDFLRKSAMPEVWLTDYECPQR